MTDAPDLPAGEPVKLPSFGRDFPAEHLRTELEWEGLALHPTTRRQIRQIETWVKDRSALVDGQRVGRHVGRRVKAGYRVLFHGPAGTGKTLTAALLGKTTGRPVLRIDLSRVVSKYIGETEKNLSKLLGQARRKEWILFFDEADALFSKRTEIRDNHDRYADQEVAYLLQVIETHPGVVILSTSRRDDIDDALLPRLEASIHFASRRRTYCCTWRPR